MNPSGVYKSSNNDYAIKMRNFVVAIAALVCASCTNEMMDLVVTDEPTAQVADPLGAGRAAWVGDAHFSDVERSQIVEGVAWIHARAGLPPPSFTWAELSDEPRPWTIRLGYVTEDVEAMANAGHCSGGRTIYLAPDMGAELPAIAAHEMGHCALGLDDDEMSEGVMRHALPLALRWTDREEGQCAASPRCAR
jgi:hypothetical protein